MSNINQIKYPGAIGINVGKTREREMATIKARIAELNDRLRQLDDKGEERMKLLAYVKKVGFDRGDIAWVYTQMPLLRISRKHREMFAKVKPKRVISDKARAAYAANAIKARKALAAKQGNSNDAARRAKKSAQNARYREKQRLLKQGRTKDRIDRSSKPPAPAYS